MDTHIGETEEKPRKTNPGEPVSSLPSGTVDATYNQCEEKCIKNISHSNQRCHREGPTTVEILLFIK
jgi:hypothetical protein